NGVLRVRRQCCAPTFVSVDPLRVLHAADRSARFLRLVFTDGTDQLLRSLRLPAIWMPSAEQLVKQKAQPVDIGGDGDVTAPNLLRACILRCHHSEGSRRFI